MQQLIPITTSTIGIENVQTVNARDLHKFLNVKSEFRNWIKNRIEDFGFTQSVDFIAGIFLPPPSEQKEYVLI
jgi:anti-repressor protein